MRIRTGLLVGGAVGVVGSAAFLLHRQRTATAYAKMLCDAVRYQANLQTAAILAAAAADMPADKALAQLLERSGKKLDHAHPRLGCSLTFRAEPENLNMLFIEVAGPGQTIERLIRLLRKHYEVYDPRDPFGNGKPPAFIGLTLMYDDEHPVQSLAAKLAAASN